MPRRYWIPAATLLVVALAYSNSFASGFVLDNKPILLQDPRIQAPTSENVSNIFSHTYWWPTGESGLYRPVTTLSYLFNYSILDNRDHPFGYHAVNLLLHWLNVVLLYFLLLRVIRDERAALVGAALWGIHPILAEAVTNIVGRADLLAGAALLGGLLLYLKYTETGRTLFLALLALVTAAGVFCKESAVVLPGLVALVEITWWRERTAQRKRIPTAAAAILVPVAIFLYCRSVVLASSGPADFPFFDNPITGAGFWTGRLTAVKVLALYLAKILWPATLSADYSYNQIPLVRDGLIAYLIVLIAAAAIWSYRRYRAVFFFGCFAFLTILPGSNLLFATGTIMAERLAYLPAAGVIACLALASRDRKGAVIVCGLIACALGGRTWVRNDDWHDQLSLSRATVAASPNSFKSHQMLAEALFFADPDHHNVDAVLAEAEKGIAILNTLPAERSSPELYRLAGACYLLKSDAASALPVLQHGAAIMTALHAKRSETNVNDDIYRLLSAAELRTGHVGNALQHAIDAQQRDPLNPGVYEQLSEAYESSGDAHRAASALMKGMLVTSDMQLRQRLIELYGRGLDTNHCAVINGPAGPAINPACDLVRRELCEVSEDAIKIATNAGKLNTARSLSQSFSHDYGCK